MKYNRIIMNRPGGPEVLQLVEEDLPEANDDKVQVKVLAAGVSYADVLMREGTYPGMPGFPLTPGYDIVGVVDRVGEDVKFVRTGQFVGALTKTGGYAEQILLPESELVVMPDGLDPAEAVSLILNYVTAWQMLHRATTLTKGDSILIHGAGGGVGTALLQLGKLMGLRMFGTASTGKHSLVESLGGTPIDYKNENIEDTVRSYVPEGIAVAFDGTGQWLYPSYRLLRSDGTLIVFGASSMMDQGRKSFLKTLLAYLRFSIFLGNLLPLKKRIVLYTITNYKKRHAEWFREDLQELFKLLEQNKIKPVIALRKPLSDAAYCHRLLNDAAVSGKMVLVPGGN